MRYEVCLMPRVLTECDEQARGGALHYLNMAEFASALSYERFEKSTYSSARYIHNEETREFLRAVLATSASRIRVVPAGTLLWRAQLGYTPDTRHGVEIRGAHQPVRMKPRADCVGDGRVNPRGIPCLYLATDDKTAMSEVRPWKGAYVSVARFEVLQDCNLVNCTQDRKAFRLRSLRDAEEYATPEKKERDVWGDIGYAFSKPVTPKEPVADYIPTQILAEAFRAGGLDGILYKSGLGKGNNVVLFNVEAAKLQSCALQLTSEVTYEFGVPEDGYEIDDSSRSGREGSVR